MQKKTRKSSSTAGCPPARQQIPFIWKGNREKGIVKIYLFPVKPACICTFSASRGGQPCSRAGPGVWRESWTHLWGNFLQRLSFRVILQRLSFKGYPSTSSRSTKVKFRFCVLGLLHQCVLDSYFVTFAQGLECRKSVPAELRAIYTFFHFRPWPPTEIFGKNWTFTEHRTKHVTE